MRLSNYVAAALAAVIMNSANAEKWTYGQFSVEWPEHCSLVKGSDPDQYKCLSGDVVVIDVLALNKSPSAAETKRYVENVTEAAKRNFANAVKKFGAEVIAPQAEVFGTSSTLVSVAGTTASSVRPSAFIVQFALISSIGEMAFVTVEGAGDPTTAYRKYRAVIKSAKWN